MSNSLNECVILAKVCVCQDWAMRVWCEGDDWCVLCNPAHVWYCLLCHIRTDNIPKSYTMRKPSRSAGIVVDELYYTRANHNVLGFNVDVKLHKIIKLVWHTFENKSNVKRISQANACACRKNIAWSEWSLSNDVKWYKNWTPEWDMWDLNRPPFSGYWKCVW